MITMNKIKSETPLSPITGHNGVTFPLDDVLANLDRLTPEDQDALIAAAEYLIERRSKAEK